MNNKYSLNVINKSPQTVTGNCNDCRLGYLVNKETLCNEVSQSVARTTAFESENLTNRTIMKTKAFINEVCPHQ